MPTPIDTQGTPVAARPVAKKTVKKPVKKAAPAQTVGNAAAAAGVSAADWKLVRQVAAAHKIDPYVLVAIGMHETGWGSQGAGQQGYTLGVGVPDGGSPQSQYQGLASQLNGAAQILANYGVHTIKDLASGVLAPHDGQVRYASDPAWTQGVVAQYNAVKGTKFASAASTATGAVDPGGTATPKSLTVKQYLDDPAIAAKYGFLSAYLKDPAIGPVLAAAAKGGWGENEILGALTDPKAGFPKAVQWWKKTSTTAALWQAQQNLEPGTAKERLGNMTGQVQQLAQSTLGQELDPGRASQIANTAIAHGWSQAQLQSAVGAEFHYNASQKAYGGLAGQTLDALRGHAADYLVPLSDQTLQQWTQGVLKGTFKDTDFQDYLKAQAESLYPTLKAPLDQGVTVKQFLNPYGQLLQSTLGVNPDGINWMDPKWSKALNTTTPDGQRAPMSLSDWGHYLRSTPDYQYTDQARQNAGDLAYSLVQHLGKVVA